MLKHKTTSQLLILFGLFFLSFSLFASPQTTETIDWGQMLMQLFGGLALFLYGMEKMADALRAVSGEKMQSILATLTRNRFMGVLTGAFVTAVVQSSSITTVLVVGFISAGLMSMAQSVGIIMGANIGTTITAQIIAFKVTKLALVMIAMGFSLDFFGKHENIKHYGSMLMGLGLIFFGMGIMSEAMQPLRSYAPFLHLMQEMANPLFGILVAAVFTALIQSSSATTGIVIVMASQGFISLLAGIALAFGANIGTCVTALLASINKPREAVRAAMVHVLFNVLGVLLWVAFIPQLAELVVWFSPAVTDATGIDKLAAETPRQIANAHTLFNIANMFLFIGFVSVFARVVEWMIPDEPLAQSSTRPEYLDNELLKTPYLALDQVRLELRRTGSHVCKMMNRIMPAILDKQSQTLNKIEKMDDKVDDLHGDIILYLGRISQGELTEGQTKELMTLIKVSNELEKIGDTIETHLVKLGKNRLRDAMHMSEQTKELLSHFHQIISVSLELSVDAIVEQDQKSAYEVLAMQEDIDKLADKINRHQVQRLVAEEPDRLLLYTLEIELLDKLKHIYALSRQIAKNTLRLSPYELTLEDS